MPWFRRQSDKAKRRLQHQQYLAKEDPGPVYDITNCEIADVPAGVYSLCKVLQKEVLLVHTNWLTSINGGGNLKDLANLRVLDLHHNDLVTLPDDLGYLTGLETLNVAQNKLKQLPNSIGHLKNLETLNAHDNKLKELPEELCELTFLASLDISKNFIHKLPAALSQVRALNTLKLDTSHMSFPGPDICKAGIEEVMRFLCKEHGINYVPPSEIKREDSKKSSSSRPEHLENEANLVNNSIRQYEQNKTRRQADRLALEQQIQEERRLASEAAALASANKQHLIHYMAQDQERIEGELSAIHKRKGSEREQLVHSMKKVEQNTSALVKQLLELSEKSRRTEALMEQMEKERMEMEKWWEVRQEELATLRKSDVIVNMEKVLSDNAWMNRVIADTLADRSDTMRRTQERHSDEKQKLDLFLNARDTNKNHLIEQLLKEEKFQKEAFEALQMQKDVKHQRIRGQIEMIEQELSQITQLEVEQRNLKLSNQMNTLAEKRQTLMKMLMQLMEERDKRESELRRRLGEMEQKKEDTQSDYWLVQYQRLMDRKPAAMVNMEKNLEFSVLEILENASATDYTSLFARHRISIETMLQITDQELKQMGVHELGVRKDILRCVEAYKYRREEERAAAKAKGIEQDADDWLVRPPEPDVAPKPRLPVCAPVDDISAPVCTPADDITSPSAPPASQVAPPAPPQEVTAHFSNECVVCMEFSSSVLFLQCGHICCCTECSGALNECPLCRAAISQKITLKQTRKLLASRSNSREDQL